MMDKLSSVTGPLENREARDLARLRDAAHRIAGSVFYQTMLKTMQNSKLKGEYGHGGRGEDIFAGQLHGILAERMGQATQRGVGEHVYRHLEKQQKRLSHMRVASETT